MSRADDELWMADLSAYLDGELSAEDARRVEQRLAADPHAQQLLNDLRADARALVGLPRITAGAQFLDDIKARLERRALLETASTASPARRGLGAITRYAAAAAIVLMTGVGGYVLWSQTRPPEHIQVATNEPRTPQPSAARELEEAPPSRARGAATPLPESVRNEPGHGADLSTTDADRLDSMAKGRTLDGKHFDGEGRDIGFGGFGRGTSSGGSGGGAGGEQTNRGFVAGLPSTEGLPRAAARAPAAPAAPEPAAPQLTLGHSATLGDADGDVRGDDRGNDRADASRRAGVATGGVGGVAAAGESFDSMALGGQLKAGVARPAESNSLTAKQYGVEELQDLARQGAGRFERGALAEQELIVADGVKDLSAAHSGPADRHSYFAWSQPAARDEQLTDLYGWAETSHYWNWGTFGLQPVIPYVPYSLSWHFDLAGAAASQPATATLSAATQPASSPASQPE